MNYESKQDNDNFLPKKYLFCKNQKEVISKLKDDLKNIDDFFDDIDYKLVANKNLSEVINTNTVVTSNDIILKNFRNKNKIKYRKYLQKLLKLF